MQVLEVDIHQVLHMQQEAHILLEHQFLQVLVILEDIVQALP